MIALYIFLSLMVILIVMLVHQADIKYKWYISLKPADKILVRIYSANCNCLVIATVTQPPVGKYVEATIDDMDKCAECARLNSVNDSLDITCWYQVTSFHRKDVVKPNRRNTIAGNIICK